MSDEESEEEKEEPPQQQENEQNLQQCESSVSSTASASSISNNNGSTNNSVVGSEDDIVILGEILGATGLVREDREYKGNFDDERDSDMKPFATVDLGETRVHRTKPCKDRGRNPIWTLSKKSLFIMRTNPTDLAGKAHYVDVSVWTKRRALSLTAPAETLFLGSIRIGAQTLLSKCNEQRITMDLVDASGCCGSRGNVTVRFRLATPRDERFVMLVNEFSSSNGALMNKKAKKKKHVAVPPKPTIQDLYFDNDEEGNPSMDDGEDSQNLQFASLTTERSKDDGSSDSLNGGGTLSSVMKSALSSAFTLNSFFDHHVQAIKYRVKPFPDPNRESSTSYLSKKEIRVETMKPSHHWIHAGSGKLGQLYLEILSCHDLPNVDVGESVGNLTDAFVTAVFEDAMVQTNVIDDELSPHWLPWTKRAFCFGILHPASMLYLGCFDYDSGDSAYDGLGRVAVNIGNLQRDTDYTLQFTLYSSSNVTQRKATGTITIRVRVEFPDERAAMLAASQPFKQPSFHVNVQKENTLRVLKYTCFGEYGDEKETKFDLTLLRSYVNEILECKRFLGYALVDGLGSLIFWRGQVPFWGLSWPVHSFLFFCAASTLVEHPQLFPAFFLLSIAWILLAVGIQRQQHPSPWFRCRSFSHYVEVLCTGQTKPRRLVNIAPQEGSAATAAYDAAWAERIERDNDLATERLVQQKHLEELQQLNDHLLEDNHTSVTERLIPVEWLSRLGRIQELLAKYLRYGRLVKILVTWEEGIVSFWLCACFLVAGLVALLLPWGAILSLSGRVIVWGFLGPHMMIVDAYLHNDKENGPSKNDKTAQAIKQAAKLQSKKFLAQLQELTKLKDIKSLIFGKYICRVPNFNLSRHYDRPLSTSFAKLHHPHGRNEKSGDASSSAADATKDDDSVSWEAQIPGQQLFGAMIPRPEGAARNFEVEFEQLQARAAAALASVQQIVQEREVHRSQRLDLAREASLPQAFGFELVAFDRLRRFSSRARSNATAAAATALRRDTSSANNSTAKKIFSNNNTRFALSATSTVEVDESAKLAVLSFRQQSNSSRQSIRFGYEVMPFDPRKNSKGDDDDNYDYLPFEVRGTDRLAIVETKEEKRRRQSSGGKAPAAPPPLEASQLLAWQRQSKSASSLEDAPAKTMLDPDDESPQPRRQICKPNLSLGDIPFSLDDDKDSAAVSRPSPKCVSFVASTDPTTMETTAFQRLSPTNSVSEDDDEAAGQNPSCRSFGALGSPQSQKNMPSQLRRSESGSSGVVVKRHSAAFVMDPLKSLSRDLDLNPCGSVDDDDDDDDESDAEGMRVSSNEEVDAAAAGGIEVVLREVTTVVQEDDDDEDEKPTSASGQDSFGEISDMDGNDDESSQPPHTRIRRSMVDVVLYRQ